MEEYAYVASQPSREPFASLVPPALNDSGTRAAELREAQACLFWKNMAQRKLVKN